MRARRCEVITPIHVLYRFCISVPSSDNHESLILDHEIFKLNKYKGNYIHSLFQAQDHVPVIVVFTKFDRFVARLGDVGAQTGENSQEFAKHEFTKRYGHVFKALDQYGPGQLPYALVSSTFTSAVRHNYAYSNPYIQFLSLKVYGS